MTISYTAPQAGRVRYGETKGIFLCVLGNRFRELVFRSSIPGVAWSLPWFRAGVDYEKNSDIRISNGDSGGGSGAWFCPRQKLPQPQLRFTELRFADLRLARLLQFARKLR